jgi:hypothetical protein
MLYETRSRCCRSRLESVSGMVADKETCIKTKIENMKMKELTIILGASVIACASVNAQVLTFEGLQNEETIGNYYNGGLGGAGSGPGPNYGITFGPDSLALVASTAGGTGNFANSPSGDTVAFFLSGPGDVMDKASGFNTGFSFYYADQNGFTGSVDVYSGLDGTGTLLASLSLPSTPNPYNVFVPVGVTFAGTAESAVFGGSANYIAFDNITLGSSTPGSGNGNAVPDNSGLSIELLAGLALASAAFVAKKNAVRC